MPGKVSGQSRSLVLVTPSNARLGASQYLAPASPLKFNLSIAEDGGDDSFNRQAEDNDAKLVAMLAAQAQHREDAGGDEDAIISNKKLSEKEKKNLLQKSLHMAASNGDVERVKRLVNENARDYVDINAADEEGTAPLIYASCFVGCSFTEVETTR
jgi:hypothetical protein